MTLKSRRNLCFVCHSYALYNFSVRDLAMSRRRSDRDPARGRQTAQQEPRLLAPGTLWWLIGFDIRRLPWKLRIFRIMHWPIGHVSAKGNRIRATKRKGLRTCWRLAFLARDAWTLFVQWLNFATCLIDLFRARCFMLRICGEGCVEAG